MLTCREITELVTDYLEGRLSLASRVRFQLHLGWCRDCRAYLRQMQDTVEVLGRLPAIQLPPDIEARLLERFRGWRTQR